MHPRITNNPTRTSDVRGVRFEPAGALGLVNEYSGFAAQPAPYIAFAELEHARPTLHFSSEEVNHEPATGN